LYTACTRRLLVEVLHTEGPAQGALLAVVCNAGGLGDCASSAGRQPGGRASATELRASFCAPGRTASPGGAASGVRAWESMGASLCGASRSVCPDSEKCTPRTAASCRVTSAAPAHECRTRPAGKPPATPRSSAATGPAARTQCTWAHPARLRVGFGRPEGRRPRRRAPPPRALPRARSAPEPGRGVGAHKRRPGRAFAGALGGQRHVTPASDIAGPLVRLGQYPCRAFESTPIVQPATCGARRRRPRPEPSRLPARAYAR